MRTTTGCRWRVPSRSRPTSTRPRRWLAAGGLAVAALLGGCVGPSSPRSASSFEPGSKLGVGGLGSGATSPPTSAPGSLRPAPSTTTATSPSGLRYGPGPRATYTVQPQSATGSCHYRFEGSDPLPDPKCTPGALNPRVTAATVASTICTSGYTSSIRPPESITEPEKQGSAAAYGYTGSFSTGEYDHLVPLELGGDPNDPANLWVEPNDNSSATSTYNSKDVLENRLHDLVCAGQLALATAQEAIASNWAAAYQTYVGGQASSPPQPSGTASASGASCTATATPANNGYSGDYYVTVNSNQPDQRATATDASNH